MLSSSYSLLLISLSAAAPNLDLSSEPAVKQALSSIAGNLMPYYLNNNLDGTIKESRSKGVDGFEWYEGGIFWGIMMEYVRTTGDTRFDSQMFTALASASSNETGSFLGSSPFFINLTRKWNQDVLWWTLPPTAGALLYGPDITLINGKSMNFVASEAYSAVWQGWDSVCGGGLYWNIKDKTLALGDKPTQVNVQQMLVAAQLTAATNNQSYIKNADLTLQWLKSSGVLASNGTLYYGVRPSENCDVFNVVNNRDSGLLLGALGWMYKVTKQQSYIQDASLILNQLLKSSTMNGVFVDSCEPTCKLSNTSPKGALIRGLGYLYEFTPDEAQKQLIKDTLTKSVQAMVKVCDDEWNCGNYWQSGQQAASKSVHDQMNAAELMTAYYKTFGVPAKMGLAPPAGSRNASADGVVGSTPDLKPNGASGLASLVALPFTIFSMALLA